MRFLPGSWTPTAAIDSIERLANALNNSGFCLPQKRKIRCTHTVVTRDQHCAMTEPDEYRKVWTALDVHDWLRKAAFAMLLMPGVRVQQYGSSWPAFVHDSNEGYCWNDGAYL